MEYIEARSVEEASRALTEQGEGAKLIAGGLALIILMNHRLLQPTCLISIRRLRELRYIRWDDAAGLRIGALTTHREIETSRVVRRRAPVLVEMEGQVGSIQVRNAGTIGGNLCHGDPREDPAPALLVLDAEVTLASAAGARSLPLRGFFVDFLSTALQPGELLTEVRVPPLPPGTGATYVKFSHRNALDFPVAGVGARVTLDADGVCQDARLALGAVGPTPLLCDEAAGLLRGERPSPGLLEEVARRARALAAPSSDVFGSEEYKRHLVGVLSRRALEQAWQVAGDGREATRGRGRQRSREGA
ncbi:MAG: xanthine dehydrogenase family protein subunit M [Deltaproteobacteria bacterium]|nr:xanthine dehydrogenase family protein subunit M [Deltaproteobacteria bacterium]